jgi:hypothetical protein
MSTCKCVNSTFLDIEVVCLHLESFGICKGYQPWDFHGESSFPMASSKTRDSHVQESSNEYGDIHEMLHDLFPNMTFNPIIFYATFNPIISMSFRMLYMF